MRQLSSPVVRRLDALVASASQEEKKLRKKLNPKVSATMPSALIQKGDLRTGEALATDQTKQ